MCQHPFIHIVTILQVSVLKEPSSGSTDTFHEPGQQNMCPDVNNRLMRNYQTEASW